MLEYELELLDLGENCHWGPLFNRPSPDLGLSLWLLRASHERRIWEPRTKLVMVLNCELI